MSYIYRTLKKKCEEDTSLTPLIAQWEFDQKLLSNALRSVVHSFPHYSMHDESHSNTILTQIEKILGIERIESLSGTDLWLLLEAAYSHDLGMVIPDKDKRDALESDDFDEFLEDIIQNKNHENYENAKLIKTPEFKELLERSPKTWPLDVSRSVTILLAEFFRSKHATRSKDLINQPSSIGLKSPRTGLIPSRLFNLLGKITESHGGDHKYVMSLPQYEDGVGMDKCHPRLISFLLRLGDLLDIDNGRFCPVLLSSFGKLPKTSEDHLGKHDAIEHLYISQSHIIIKAKANNYEIHSLLSDWFDWIKQEISFISRNLNSIVPNIDFGSFPVANDLFVELLDYEIIENSQRPKIEIESEKIMEMIRGTNLYSSANVFVRELLQNSVDATLLKYFNDNRDSILTMKSPIESYEALNNNDLYKIKINLTEIPFEDSKMKIKLEIEDSGIGISREEISYILNMGSSTKNLRRKKIRKQMPEWLKPSGYFGIGFQSIFQVVDDVTISTKSIYDINEYEIAFKEKGNHVMIKKIENKDFIAKPFTRITVEIDSEKIPKRFSYKYENDRALQTISNYDSLLDDNLPIEKANLIYDINIFSSDYYIPIYLNGFKINNEEYQLRGDFCPESNCFLNIKPVMSRLPGSDISYRNQIVLKNTRDLYMKYLTYELDIMEGKANDYLSFSREKLSQDGMIKIDEILKLEIPKLLELKYSQNTEDKKLLSLAYFANFDKPSKVIKDDWKDFEISSKNDSSKNGTLRDILQANSIILKYEKKISELEKLSIQMGEDEYILDSRVDILDFLIGEIHKEFPYYQLKSMESYSETKLVGNDIPIQDNVIKKEFYFSTNDFQGDGLISLDIIKSLFNFYEKRYKYGTNVRRTLLPIFSKKYFMISINLNDAIKELPYVLPIFDSIFKIYQNCIISPFVIENGQWTVKGLEEAKRKTFDIKQKIEPSINYDEISKVFDDLVTEINQILIMKDNEIKE